MWEITTILLENGFAESTRKEEKFKQFFILVMFLAIRRFHSILRSIPKILNLCTARIYMCICVYVFAFVWFYDISTIVSYLMPNLFLYI